MNAPALPSPAVPVRRRRPARGARRGGRRDPRAGYYGAGLAAAAVYEVVRDAVNRSTGLEVLPSLVGALRGLSLGAVVRRLRSSAWLRPFGWMAVGLVARFVVVRRAVPAPRPASR